MLGIGGALQSQFQHQPPADRHMKNVLRIINGGVYDCEEAYDDKHDDGPSSSSSRSSTKKRKRNEKEELSSKKTNFANGKSDGEGTHIVDVISEGKKKLQSADSRNGVTFAFIGSSGCGKSTLIRDVFLDQIFTKKAKEEDKKDFICTIFTESAKSDAFRDLDKNILVDSAGLDEDNINFCFQMNMEYEKKYHFFLILDDVLDIQYKHLVKRMFLTMRNTNISSLVSLQYPNLIPKSIRTSVYFTVLFYMNTDEAVELAVRGWLSPYLEGNTIREKMLTYRQWTRQKGGHQMYLVDNLNHRCYQVDSEYMCYEIDIISTIRTPPRSKKMKKDSYNLSSENSSPERENEPYESKHEPEIHEKDEEE